MTEDLQEILEDTCHEYIPDLNSFNKEELDVCNITKKMIVI